MDPRLPILGQMLLLGKTAAGAAEAPVASLVDLRARLERARRHIDAHFAAPLDLNQLAQVACFSRHHFLRLFKFIYGITPYQYLIRRRMERAKELLIQSKYNVTEVCFEVGFESLGSFSAQFKRVTGSPPIAYRAGLFRPVPRSLIWPRVLVPYCLIAKMLPPKQLSNFREAPTVITDYHPAQPSEGENA